MIHKIRRKIQNFFDWANTTHPVAAYTVWTLIIISCMLINIKAYTVNDPDEVKAGIATLRMILGI